MPTDKKTYGKPPHKGAYLKKKNPTLGEKYNRLTGARGARREDAAIRKAGKDRAKVKTFKPSVLTMRKARNKERQQDRNITKDSRKIIYDNPYTGGSNRTNKENNTAVANAAASVTKAKVTGTKVPTSKKLVKRTPDKKLTTAEVNARKKARMKMIDSSSNRRTKQLKDYKKHYPNRPNVAANVALVTNKIKTDNKRDKVIKLAKKEQKVANRKAGQSAMRTTLGMNKKKKVDTSRFIKPNQPQKLKKRS